MTMTVAERRRRNLANTTRVHNERRAQGVCINGDESKVWAGGRCRSCWERKLAAERIAYAKRKAAR